MGDSAADNKRIAKNTLYLYGRMLLSMCVSFYTSRVLLNTLGVVDYGVYGVVGGIVAMFMFLNGALITSTQRYINFELGRGNKEKLNLVFNTSLRIHFIVAFVIVFLSETIGMWFFYNKMVIPAERMDTAFGVFQISILTTVVAIISTPYNAVIVAHEKMNIFALFSILEVFLKLAVALALQVFGYDKLLTYAILIASVHIFMRFIYGRYCKIHFEETSFCKIYDKSLMVKMSKFTGWNIWGNLAAVLYGSGLNLLLNTFFDPVVNAARAVAITVEGSLAQFVGNFLVAVNPQITKLYSQNRLSEMHSLIFRSAKFSCLLLFMVSLPVLIETETILTLWLKTVPDYTIQFIRLLIFIGLVDNMARPLITAAAATGNVKLYQSAIGGILLAIVPISYVVLLMGGNPTSVYVVHLIVAIVAFIVRLIIIRPLINMSIVKFFRMVILPFLIVLAISIPIGITLHNVISEGIISSLIVCVLCSLIAGTLAYAIGFTKNERKFINEKIAEVYHKILRR